MGTESSVRPCCVCLADVCKAAREAREQRGPIKRRSQRRAASSPGFAGATRRRRNRERLRRNSVDEDDDTVVTLRRPLALLASSADEGRHGAAITGRRGQKNHAPAASVAPAPMPSPRRAPASESFRSSFCRPREGLAPTRTIATDVCLAVSWESSPTRAAGFVERAR
ncbi:unnamed protein product [Lampetra fluviatilis]